MVHDLSSFPAINASLNLATVFLLLLGWFQIKQRAITGHTVCMILATLTSALFLGCYLYYHAHHGSTKFPGTGPWRPVYFTILLTHTVLATVQVPLILATHWFAWRGRFDKHVRVARITLPVWLYVSVTGVVVYWMLYRMDWR
jgi:uncharacterized membrane protein YozB (DUF420 family)